MGVTEGRHHADDLDPARTGVFQWAWVNAKEWRTEWWLGSVVFAVIGVVAGIIIPSSWGNKPELALIALGMAAIVVMLSSLAYALLVALHQQRNALRSRFTQTEPSRPARSDNQAESPRNAISQQAWANESSTIIQAGRDIRDISVGYPQTRFDESNNDNE